MKWNSVRFFMVAGVPILPPTPKCFPAGWRAYMQGWMQIDVIPRMEQLQSSRSNVFSQTHKLQPNDASRLNTNKLYQQKFGSNVSTLPQLDPPAKHTIITNTKTHRQLDNILPQIPNKTMTNGYLAHQEEQHRSLHHVTKLSSAEILPDSSNKSQFNKQEKERTLEGHRLPLTPTEALNHFRSCLTEYEQEEIIDYTEVWFLGQDSEKVEGIPGGGHNCGYDDDHGSYFKVLHDHIAYRFEVLEVIGKGSFGQVVKCLDHKTNELVAIKIIRNKKRLNLYELIKKNNFQGFSMALIRRFAYAILKCLQLLHREKIIHCDLKPENILLFQKGQGTIKVIDFGSSCYEHQRVYTYIQSRFYRSPEVILGHPYGMAIDMWSLGCILAELYSGYPLFPGENEGEQLACIMEVPISFIIPTPITMSIEVITIDQRTVTYRVVSMPRDGTYLFHSVCYILHSHIRLTLGIRRNIVSYVLNDWDRFKVWTDDSTGDNYTTQEHYKNEMLKPFTYGSAYSKGFPRNVTNSKGRKRKPNSRDLATVLKINDPLFLDFLKGCLMWDPLQRLTPDEAMQHEWIQELRSNKGRSKTRAARKGPDDVTPVFDNSFDKLYRKTSVARKG
ncbi:DYRK4 kinase, partial [Polypterus senegalus]